MPRHHFAIVNGITVPDPEGIELPDEARARSYAENVARRLKAEKMSRLTIRVSDDNGHLLFEIRV